MESEFRNGALHRRIEIATHEDEARAVVEDDYHHFRVAIFHDGAYVTDTKTSAPRYPWSLCPSAGDRLQELVGMPLQPTVGSILGTIDQRMQCTHQLDIAALAIAAAARCISRRRYEATVPDRIGADRSYAARHNGLTRATLKRDGNVVMYWDLDGTAILSPDPFAGQSLKVGFTQWCLDVLPAGDAEAAFVLRRAVFISGGSSKTRAATLDTMSHAQLSGGCYVTQLERAPQALRMVGSTRDFSSNPGALTQDDADWITFVE